MTFLRVPPRRKHCFVLLTRCWGTLETRPPVALGSSSELSAFFLSLAPLFQVRPWCACYVWHDVFICVIWLLHMCDMTLSCVCHDSVRCETLLHDMCHPVGGACYVSYDSFIGVTWILHMCHMPLTIFHMCDKPLTMRHSDRTQIAFNIRPTPATVDPRWGHMSCESMTTIFLNAASSA